MLKFQRNKLVSIFQDNPDEVQVHGLLDDHIFGLELDIGIRLENMTITTIQGKWNREETPECSRALPFLEAAKGFRIDDEALAQKINKVVSRKACPHFANLLLECCLAAREAVRVVMWESARTGQADLTFAEFLADAGGAPKTPQPAVSDAPQPEDPRPASPCIPKPRTQTANGFCVDLHTHSFPASQCSTAGVDDLIVEAKRIGLDAICLTDHNHVWSPADIAGLVQKHGFPVFRGNEITTDQGDVLVFGMHQDVKGIISLGDLEKMVDEADGFMVAAHPFRGFLVFNTSQIGMTVEKAMQRPAYRQVHALETRNGKVTLQENNFAAEVAAGMGLPATGGSDAHAVGDVGKYATCFQKGIQNEKDLVAALKSGDYEPCAFRRSCRTGATDER